MVLRYSEALVDVTGHFENVYAFGLDELSSCAEAPITGASSPPRSRTSKRVDSSTSSLVEVPEARCRGSMTRSGLLCSDRLGDHGPVGPYRAVFRAMVPGITQVADPFHVVRHANAKLDECRRRVQKRDPRTPQPQGRSDL